MPLLLEPAAVEVSKGLIVLSILAAAMIWIRFAPSDPASWHVDPFAAKDPGIGGHLVTVSVPGSPDAVLAALHQLAIATPGTRVLAGALAESRITYVTRSRIWGFPDYTTVAVRPQAGDSQLAILGRLRFGKSDFRVNRDRIQGWLQAIEAVGQ